MILMKWQAEFFLCIFVIAVVLQPKSVTDGCMCELIVALPNLLSNELGPAAPSWERGAEILPGATDAKEQINNVLNSECKLKLIAVNNGQCGAHSNFGLFEQFVTIVRQQNNCYSHSNYQCLHKVPIVGLSCNNVISHTVISLSSEELIRESLNKIYNKFVSPMVKPAAAPLTRALFEFMKRLNWQKLGIITETGSTYFSRMAEEVCIKAKNDSNVDIIAYRQLQANEKIDLTQSASRITLLSTSQKATVDILCSAYKEHAVWPEYVWILHSYLLKDIIEGISARCSINRALENVIIVRRQIPGTQPQNNYSTNPYSIILHNLVWVSAHKLLNLSTPKEESLLHASYPGVIEFTQVRNATDNIIALVDINGFLDDQIKRIVISDEFERRFEGASTGYTVIFSIEIVVGFAFVTIMLIGYVYFRNEPEVKSTSFMLSLLIFLGCYLNLIFLLFLLYFHQPIMISEDTLNAICGIFPWISGLGISITLIIATVLVKLARVHYIFNRFTAKPMGKLSSDIVLAGYVLLILLPMIIILMTWMITDRFKITYQPSSQIGFTQK